MTTALRSMMVAALTAYFNKSRIDAPQRYLDLVGQLPSFGRLSRRARQVLLNLPATGQFTVQVENDGDQFQYCTDPSDNFHLSCRMQFSEYEPATRVAFARLARISSSVVDVGAYAGLYTLIATSANRRCTVRAFEPNPVTFKLLERNVEIGSLDSRVRMFALGLSNRSEDVVLFGANDFEASTTASLIPSIGAEATDSVTIRVVRLDDLALDWGIDLMKIDVEGFEVEALEGARSVLASSQPSILTEALTDDALVQQGAFLQTFGYASPILVKAGHESDERNYFWIHPSRMTASLVALGDIVNDLTL